MGYGDSDILVGSESVYFGGIRVFFGGFVSLYFSGSWIRIFGRFMIRVFWWVPVPGILMCSGSGYFDWLRIRVFWWVPDPIIFGWVPNPDIFIGSGSGYVDEFRIRVIEKLRSGSNFFFRVGSGTKTFINILASELFYFLQYPSDSGKFKLN